MKIEGDDSPKKWYRQGFGFWITFGLLVTLLAIRGTDVVAAMSGAAFLNIDPSPRSYALGGARVVTSLGAQAIGANPANLIGMRNKYEVFTTYTNMFEDVRYLHISGAILRSRSGKRVIDALGVSITNLGVGGFDGRTSQGVKTDSFSAQDTAVALTASGKLRSGLNLGLTTKILTSNIGDYGTGYKMASDVGVSYEFKKFALPLNLALSLNNFGQSLRFKNQSDPLPSAVEMGASLNLAPLLVVVKSAYQMYQKKTEMSLGVEYGMGPLALRAGYRGAKQNGEDFALRNANKVGKVLNGFSTGLGFRMRSVRMDYALGQDAAEFSLSHRISLTMQWGRKNTRAAQKRLTQR